MNVQEYRDLVDGLQRSLRDFMACVNFAERDAASKRIADWWKRLSLTEQPKRLSAKDTERRDRALQAAAAHLNNWLTEVDSGNAEAADDRPRQEPPVKAIADTMRFCNSMKRYTAN